MEPGSHDQSNMTQTELEYDRKCMTITNHNDDFNLLVHCFHVYMVKIKESTAHLVMVSLKKEQNYHAQMCEFSNKLRSKVLCPAVSFCVTIDQSRI